MPVAWDDLYEVLVELTKIKELKATTYNSLKGGLITGAAAIVGGLLLGKYGLLLGGALGGGASAAATHDFTPVWIILRDLPYEKKETLCSKVISAFRDIGIQDVALAATILSRDTSIERIAIREISRYLHDEYNLRIN